MKFDPTSWRLLGQSACRVAAGNTRPDNKYISDLGIVSDAASHPRGNR
jgi:hypothetical protein